MKRVFQIVFLLIFLYFVYQFISMLFINEHKTSYILKTDDKEFSIKEEFVKKNKKHDYYFEVDVDKHRFVFHNSSDLNKKKQIIKKIEYFEVKDLFCIYPVIEDKEEVNQNDIICDKNKELVTYSYLKQQNNIYIDAFVQNLQQKEYNNESWNQVNQEDSYENLTIYSKNIVEDYVISIWNYKGINIVNSESRYLFKILNQDRYENTHSRLVGKYFVIPDYDEKHEFDTWYLIDIVDWAKEKMKLDYKISFDSYINGIIDGEIYITDRSSKKQYAINPNKKTSREVGNTELNGTYYDGEWHNRNIYDLVNKELYFLDVISLDSMSNEYGSIDIKKSNQEYYFKTEDGRVYQTFENNKEEAILLFQDNNIVDWKVVDNVIYYLSGSIIYQYDDYTGLKKVIESNEFKFNYKNIFEVYKK